MKWIISISIWLLMVACSSELSSNLDALLVDRIWLSSPNQTQFYFSSTDQVQYLWMAVERRNGNGYISFSPAKGTPESHPLPEEYTDFKEGWYASSNFKIEGDSIFFQDEDDILGEYIHSYHIKLGMDTTIGLFDFNTIIATNEIGQRMWRSKK